MYSLRGQARGLKRAFVSDLQLCILAHRSGIWLSPKTKNQTNSRSSSFVCIVQMANAGRGRAGARRGGNRRRGQMARGTHAARTVALPNHVNLRPTYTAPYKFSRAFTIGTLPKGATDLGHAFPFGLSLLPNYSEFTNLFDRYRIRQVDIRMVLAQKNANGVNPTLWAYMDDDDASIPISKSQVLERQSVRPFTFSDAKSVYSVSIQPRWLLDSTSKASLAPRDMWIDMSHPAVSHYGLKLWAEHYNSDAVIALDATIHFECQCVR